MNVIGSGAPSSAGRVSGGRSGGVGLLSACSSFGVFIEWGMFAVVASGTKGKNTTVKTFCEYILLKNINTHKHDGLNGA